MAAQKLVAVKQFCSYHNISQEFIQHLRQNDIIELVMVKRTRYIPENQLQILEKALRLYNDLQLNAEGIQTILHLLSSLEKKQAEINMLQNQLEFYSINQNV